MPAEPRSWLFIPGANPRFMRHADAADAVILDLEDGLADSELDTGRRQVHAASASAPGRYWIRTHAASHEEFRADAACVGPAAGLILAKAESGTEVRTAAELGLPIILLIETARGLANLQRLCNESELVQGLAFGCEDFSASLRLPPQTQERSDFLDHARRVILIEAAASDLRYRLDAPSLELHSTDAVSAAARHARSLGFSGMLAVHPAQVAPIRHGFAPTESELAWQQSLSGADPGGGASSRAGRMVDRAVLRQVTDEDAD